ncbi:MAG: hypothetical protein WHX93_04005 [bacterium]
MKRVVLWGLILLGGLFFWMWLRGGLVNSGLRSPRELFPSAHRQSAPEILVRDLGGTTASIPGQLRGPALVVFWASW